MSLKRDRLNSFPIQFKKGEEAKTRSNPIVAKAKIPGVLLPY